jgi:hypothetical protein
MAIKTYKTPDNKIYTEGGEWIRDLGDYQAKVRAGVYQTSIPVNSLPSATRTPDGGIQYKNESSLTSKFSNLDKLNSNTGFLQTAKDIIQRKSQIQQPLSEAKAYWRTIQRDTTPFGGLRDKALEVPGMFTDERMRELSPSEQASVQAARDAAASAHIQGITEEEEYRGTREEDMITAMKDLLEEKDKIAKEAINSEEQKLDIIKKKTELGLPVSDSDYKAAGLDATSGRVGGTISWRYNNPGNIKFGNFAASYGATKGAEASDGGSFAIFPDLATGEQARKDLLLGKTYASLDPDTAMLKWSGGLTNGKPNGKGYTYQKLVKLGAPSISKPFSQFTDEEWSQLQTAWNKAEGWKEGTIVGQDQGIKHVTWTESAVRALAAKIPNIDSTQLWNNYTDAQLDEMAKGASGDVVEQIITKIKPAAFLRIGITQSDARELLTMKQMGLTDIEIKEAMTGLNLDPKILDELNKLLTTQENSSDIFALFSLLGQQTTE